MNAARSCYHCVLYPICSARRALSDRIIKEHIDFFNVDERDPKKSWQLLMTALGTACVRHTPAPPEKKA